VLGAAFSGFAVVSIIAIALRSWFGLKNLFTDEHLDLPAGKTVSEVISALSNS
jgi:hypothetical protein